MQALFVNAPQNTFTEYIDTENIFFFFLFDEKVFSHFLLAWFHVHVWMPNVDVRYLSHRLQPCALR